MNTQGFHPHTRMLKNVECLNQGGERLVCKKKTVRMKFHCRWLKKMVVPETQTNAPSAPMPLANDQEVNVSLFKAYYYYDK